MGNLSVIKFSPSNYWADINGELPLQTAVHVKGTLQGLPSHQIGSIITCLVLASYEILVLAACSLWKCLMQQSLLLLFPKLILCLIPVFPLAFLNPCKN